MAWCLFKLSTGTSLPFYPTLLILKKEEAYEITFPSACLYPPNFFRLLCGPCRVKGKYAISSS
jgi:hypothetical protein